MREQDKPTKSLKWYYAYNGIKHDRINNYKDSTLEYAIDAVSAVAILMIAQFGIKNIYWKDKMEKYFRVSQFPDWEYSDLYLPPIYKEGLEPTEVKYNFT